MENKIDLIFSTHFPHKSDCDFLEERVLRIQKVHTEMERKIHSEHGKKLVLEERI